MTSKGKRSALSCRSRQEFRISPPLVDELKGHVAKKTSPIARPGEILFAAEMPKEAVVSKEETPEDIARFGQNE
jgi:acyl-coenzyme A synthetase/AMP-(fatty) acid ligase